VFGGKIVLSAILAQSLMMVNFPFVEGKGQLCGFEAGGEKDAQ